ncbi:MAG: haloacid dehalogenase type II [Pyrinomonadaceae bacterium]|nr:haloacid dehalogenase type II [Phycisphaerales bacterium]
MVSFDHLKAITFDCYGTLIDWEAGLLRSLRDVGFDRTISDDALLEAFAAAEAAAESPARGYIPYKDVLREVLAGLLLRFGVAPSSLDPYALANSIPEWPAFVDTQPALTALKTRFQLVVVSNIDRDLFSCSLPKLGVMLDGLVTAEDVRSYKPAPAHFRRALEVLGLPASSVLHVAQSLCHDVKPAKALGFTTVWVNRRAGKTGAGATAPAEAAPDLVAPDLRTLVEMIGSAE